MSEASDISSGKTIGDSGGDRLEDLLVELFDCFEEGGDSAVNSFIASHADDADFLRARFESLKRIGLVEKAGSPSENRRIGEFRILGKIGEGGMGVVHLSEQTSLRRLCALKIIHPHIADSQKAGERFRREAQAMARLRHPNAAAVYQWGEVDGVLFIAMEWIEGEGLDQEIKRAQANGGQLAVADVVRWGKEIASALAAAHGAGLVHRDVKPSNIKIARDGRAVLLDFGLAFDKDDARLSMTGGFVGSPHYAAPEQISPTFGPIAAATDVYGLGATLFEALSGVPLRSGRTTEEIFRAILESDARDVRSAAPHVPRDLAAIVAMATDRDPARRYTTAAEFADDLCAFAEYRPVRARHPGPIVRLSRAARRRPATTLLALLAIAAVVAWPIVGWIDRRSVAERRVTEIRDGVARAAAIAEKWRDERAAASAVVGRLHAARNRMETAFMSPDEARELDRLEEIETASRRDHGRDAWEALAALDRADDLAIDVARSRTIRIAILTDLWREARDLRDTAGEAYYRRMIVDASRGDSTLFERATIDRVSIASDPPGAEVHLFRFRELAELIPGGDPRLCPVPAVAEDASAFPAPGTRSLRIVEGAGDLLPEDLVLTVDGASIDSFFAGRDFQDVLKGDRLLEVDGQPAESYFEVDPPRFTGEERKPHRYVFGSGGRRSVVVSENIEADTSLVTAADRVAAGGVSVTVFSNDAVRTMTVPAGLVVRKTAAPYPLGKASFLGRTPIKDAEILRGDYLAVLRYPGYVAKRFPLVVEGGRAIEHVLRLDPQKSLPAGFIRVTTAGDDFLIAERETTAAEYLEFLNDPETLKRIAESPSPIYFPRRGAPMHESIFPRGPDGKFSIADHWRADWPILSIDFGDADAYAEWRDAKEAARGSRWRIALPTFEDLATVCGMPDRRRYPFGTRFRPRFAKSCFSRKMPCPEPVMTFIVDESPAGVFDLAGGAREWCSGWFWEAAKRRRIAGGSWATGARDHFASWYSEGRAANEFDGTGGIRLLARPR